MSTGLKANVDGSAAIQVGGVDAITLTSGGAATFLTSPTTVQAGTAAAPSLTFSGDTNTGIFSPAADTIAFTEGGVESMRIDASGNMGLGVTPSAWNTAVRALEGSNDFKVAGGLTVDVCGNAYLNTSNSWTYRATGNATFYRQTSGEHRFFTAPSGTAGNAITWTQAMTLDASGNLWVGTTTGANSRLYVINPNVAQLIIGYNNTSVNYFDADTQIFRNSVGTERARIDSSGNLLVAKTSDTTNGAGITLGVSGYGRFVRSGDTALVANRANNDGIIVSLQQDAVEEGTISVSGTTVSYNGGHLSRWSQTADNTRIELLKGTVMSNLDQMAVWIDPETGEPQANEQLNCMKVSDVEGDVNVAGVFVNWDNDDDVFTNDMNIAMTGDMIIRIAQGVTVQRGDLLMSAGDGTAKPQGDDIIRSKTVAKVTSTHVTCTYEDGSYCVPCVLMAC